MASPVGTRDGTARVLVLLALGAGILVIGATAIAAEITDRSPGFFTRDVRTLSGEAGAKLPVYAGAVSQLNIMVWAAAAALALLAAWLLPKRRVWFAIFGTFILVLGADDALTLHEGGPRRVIPEPLFYLVYAVLGVALLLGLRHRPVDDVARAFLLGAVLLAGSVLVDQALEHHYLWEDGAKLLGALVWLTVPVVALLPLRALVDDRAPPVNGEIRLPADQGTDDSFGAIDGSREGSPHVLRDRP